MRHTYVHSLITLLDTRSLLACVLIYYYWPFDQITYHRDQFV